MELPPCVRRHAFYIVAILLLPLAPNALKSYPQTPLRAVSWACAKVTQGLASGAFILTVWMICWLARDAFEISLIHARGMPAKTTTTPPTPAELEDGSTRDNDLTAAPRCTPSTALERKPITTLSKLTTILITTGFFVYALLMRAPASRSQPHEPQSGESHSDGTLRTVLTYILNGWVVLAVGFVLLVLWKLPEAVRQQRSQSCGVEVLPEMPVPEDAGAEVEKMALDKA